MGFLKKNVPETQELTHQELTFVHEYFKTMCNGAQAAINAKYATDASKGRYAALRLLEQANIKKYIESVRNDLGAKLGVTRERVLAELAKIAFFNIKSLFDTQGNLKPIQDVDDDSAAAINGIDVESLGKNDQPLQLLKSRYRISNKLDALNAINIMLGYNAPAAPQLPLGPDGQPLNGMPQINIQINNNHQPPRTDLDGE